MMEDKIEKTLNRYINTLVFKSNKEWGTMVKELSELFEVELKKRLSLYEKLEGDAFVDDIK
jgi:cell division septum initiation protein DivIVA